MCHDEMRVKKKIAEKHIFLEMDFGPSASSFVRT